MINVDDHHLRCAACRSSRLDRSCSAVEYFEETHQARRNPTARELFALGTQWRKVRARARAVLENASFARDQIEYPPFIDQVISNALDKACMGLRPRVRIGGGFQLACFWFDVVVPLRRTGNAIRPRQPCIEPLRRIRRCHLCQEHVGKLIVERLSVIVAIEVAVALPPIGPTPY